jgi:hypothetical protein
MKGGRKRVTRPCSRPCPCTRSCPCSRSCRSCSRPCPCTRSGPCRLVARRRRRRRFCRGRCRAARRLGACARRGLRGRGAAAATHETGNHARKRRERQRLAHLNRHWSTSNLSVTELRPEGASAGTEPYRATSPERRELPWVRDQPRPGPPLRRLFLRSKASSLSLNAAGQARRRSFELPTIAFATSEQRKRFRSNRIKLDARSPLQRSLPGTSSAVGLVRGHGEPLIPRACANAHFVRARVPPQKGPTRGSRKL